MNDRLPGTCWSNPIWYGKWRIYLADLYDVHGSQWEYVHDSYDGAPDAGDSRCGLAQSVEECKAKIDEFEND